MARPAIEALAEQQREIAVLREENQRLAARLGGMVRVAEVQQEQINRFGMGLRHLSQLAGVEGKVVTAMTKQADVQNPAQPIPEPPAVPPTQTTQEAEAPEAQANVQTPGLVPGSTQDVAADATTTAYTPGMDIPGPAFKNLVDVTAPVAGTQGPLPLSQVKTETDVRVGDAMTPDAAFPLQGPFANAQRTSKKRDQDGEGGGNRTMAAIRLARLRIEAGIAEPGGDLELAATIEKDASVSTQAIQNEIATLTQVRTASKGRNNDGNRNQRLVPRMANQRQAGPSMASGGIQATASGDNSDAEDIFLS
jgi:hypothetical protein